LIVKRVVVPYSVVQCSFYKVVSQMLIREAYKNNCPLYRTYGPTSSYGFPRS